jgi:hypothetical protein
MIFPLSRIDPEGPLDRARVDLQPDRVLRSLMSPATFSFQG